MQPIRHIMVAVDLAGIGAAGRNQATVDIHAGGGQQGLPAGSRLLAEVIPLAQALRASVEIVYVRQTWPFGPFGPLPEVDEFNNWIDQQLTLLSRPINAAGVPCMTTCLQGSVRAELIAHAKKTRPGLVVLGNHGRWHVLESQAEQRLINAHRRILVLPVLDGDE